MATLGYVTTENVRAVLGVTEVELPDNSMTDLLVEEQVNVSLLDVYPDHVALNAKIVDLSATAEEIAIWNVLKLYIMYESAVTMLPGLQNLIAQKISDGDTEMQRFLKDDLNATIGRITAQRDRYRGLVNADFAFDVSSSSYVLAIVVPTRDPVVDV